MSIVIRDEKKLIHHVEQNVRITFMVNRKQPLCKLRESDPPTVLWEPHNGIGIMECPVINLAAKAVIFMELVNDQWIQFNSHQFNSNSSQFNLISHPLELHWIMGCYQIFWYTTSCSSRNIMGSIDIKNCCNGLFHQSKARLLKFNWWSNKSNKLVHSRCVLSHSKHKL